VARSPRCTRRWPSQANEAERSRLQTTWSDSAGEFHSPAVPGPRRPSPAPPSTCAKCVCRSSRERSLGHKADRAAGSIGVVTEFALEIKQIAFQVDLKPELVGGVALVAAAGAVLLPEILEGVEPGCHRRDSDGQPRWLPAAP
jgi:hypothetical protein